MTDDRRRLAHPDIGAWVLKGHPRGDCGYFTAPSGSRRPGSVVEASWTVGATYRTHLVEAGDPMVLWITGATDPGIHEVGTVTGPAERISARQFLVPYRAVLLPTPISYPALRADPVLSGVEQFRIPVIGNPTYLTPDQRDGLLPMLTSADRRAAGWAAPPRRRTTQRS